MKTLVLTVLLSSLPMASCISQRCDEDHKPNILVIVSDDQGYWDAGFQGCTDIPTPNLDKLARSGLRCTNGYATHSYCAPSRAALMTGRYQMRYGFEYNPTYNPNDHHQGVDVSEKMMPRYLLESGYATAWVGKWHLGAAPEFRPENRGFQETFGFIGGGHDFMDWQPDANTEYRLPIERQGRPMAVEEHLTTAFGHQAATFIEGHKNQPWFLYLAFNAPHMPNQPTAERLKRFQHIKNATRRSYAAQVSLMDDAIGETLQALEDSGQRENTLVFFMSDNGGQIYSGADNTPLRDKKGTTFEGGIRVPFLISWPSHLPSGKDYDGIVSALDVLPTALAIADAEPDPSHSLDGVNLLPYLQGKVTGSPPRTLFWRQLEAGQWAIRDDNWKLLVRSQDWRRPGGRNLKFEALSMQLFNLDEDARERLEHSNQEKIEALKSKLDRWNGSPIPSDRLSAP